MLRCRQTLTLIALAFVAGGCAGYEGSVKDIRSALLAGEKERALQVSNQVLKVERSDDLPEDLSGDNALLVLERGAIKQGLDLHKSAVADFRAADKHLELLDLRNDTMGNIGKFLFSDDSTVYKAPAYEKLLLNTFNMLNYLALTDIEEARVESRRLNVMQDYLKDEESKQGALLGLGSYFAGFAFEMSKRYEQALQYYDEALADGLRPSLKAPVQRLAACSNFRTQRLDSLLGAAGPAAECNVHPSGTGTVLVVSLVGLAPYKEAKRIPIGLAFAIAAHAMQGPGLTAEQQARANKLVAKGLLTWINFPVMNKSPEQFVRADVAIDGEAADVELGVDVTSKVLEAWDSIKGTLMVAAITRMLTRLVAGEVTEQAAKGGGAAGVVALLAGLAVQGTLTAADTPDTRSWVTLPSQVFVTRKELSAGRHSVEVTFSGNAGRSTVRRDIEVPDGGFAVVPIASMR